MRAMLFSFIALWFAVPALAQSGGVYRSAETMRSDQAFVGDLARRGAAALEAGDWATAAQLCGNLNRHLDDSPYMGERANQVASEIGQRCYADAQAMLGNVESACRIYARFEHKAMLSRIDPVAICRASANPAAPTLREIVTREYYAIRKNLETMNALLGVLNKLPATDPSRAMRIAELRSTCAQLPGNLNVNRIATDGFAHFCLGRAHFYAGDTAASCAESRRSQEKFDSLGMPLAASVPHTDYVLGIKAALQDFLANRCPG